MLEIDSEAVWTLLGDEVAILDLRAGEYFGLDGVGARIWCLIAEKANREQIVCKLVEEFEVDEQQVRRDLDELIGELLEKGLLKDRNETV